MQRADGTSVLCHKNVWPHPKETFGKTRGEVLLQMARSSITTGDAQIQFAVVVLSGLCWHNQQVPCWSWVEAHRKA